MATKRIGRPPVRPADRKVPLSFSISAKDRLKIEAIAKRHGVTISQIIYDGFQALSGDLEQTLQQLRMELAQQEEIATRLLETTKTQQADLKRLEGSQELVKAIINPYGDPDAKLAKSEKDKARFIRWILSSDDRGQELMAIAEGRMPASEAFPYMQDGIVAFGSADAFFHAAQAAKTMGAKK